MTDDVIVTESDAATDEGQQTDDVTDTETGSTDAAADESAEGEEEGEQDADAEADTEEADDEEVEFDFGGAKERFKKSATVAEVAERLQGFAKQIYGDYIQKTQKTAAQAKALESRAEELKVLGDGSQEYYLKLGVALQQGKYLEGLREINLHELWQSDPDQARRISDEIRRTEGSVSQIAQEMSRIENETKTKHSEILAKRLEDGKRAVHATIPDFETKHAGDVVKYVTAHYNVSEEDARQWALSPEVTKMAYKAMLYDQARERAKAPPKIKAVDTPVKALKGRGTARKLDPASPESDALSDAEWFQLRQKQITGR